MRENPTAVRSKAAIEAALIACMLEMPYSKITIRAITERASLSRQTFYLHFCDKDAVLSCRLLSLFSEIMDRIEARGVETVPQLVSVYTGIVVENADFLRLLAQNHLTGLVCHLYCEKLNALPPVLTCQRVNQTEAERRYFNTFWVAAFVDAYALWLMENMRTERAEIERIMVDIMLGSYFRQE